MGDRLGLLTFTLSTNVLVDLCALCAGNSVLARLNLKGSAAEIVGTAVLAQSVHAPLKSIALPAEQIVAVLTVAGTSVIWC